MNLVLDASVAIKWFFRDEPNEQDAQRALQILQAVGSGEARLVQPPHFMAEMCAVLARETYRQTSLICSIWNGVRANLPGYMLRQVNWQ